MHTNPADHRRETDLTTQTAPAATFSELVPANRAILLVDVAASLKLSLDGQA